MKVIRMGYYIKRVLYASRDYQPPGIEKKLCIADRCERILAIKPFRSYFNLSRSWKSSPFRIYPSTLLL